MHVMFLYAATGSGHLKAAEYVKEALYREDSTIRTSLVDVLKLCRFPVESFVLRSFHLLVSSNPNLYRFLYRITENNAFFNYLAGLFFSKSVLSLQKQCLHYGVHTIICTHPFALLFASGLKRKMHGAAPRVMGIVTDFKIHRFWVYPSIDFYCVPNMEMQKLLLDMGWRKEQIKVTGIPCPVDIRMISRSSDIKRPFLIVTGGGWGLGHIEKATQDLLTRCGPFHILVLTGKNHVLYRRLKTMEQTHPDRLTVKETIPHLYQEMKQAFAVLTKPGGLTVTEAMILKKPLILLKPLPGAEERNQKFLLAQGAAVSYGYFLKNPEIIRCWQKFAERQSQTAPDNSSQLIAGWILEMTK